MVVGEAGSAHLRQGDTLQPIGASNHFTQLTTATMFQAPQLKPSGLRVRRDGCRAEGHLRPRETGMKEQGLPAHRPALVWGF